MINETISEQTNAVIPLNPNSLIEVSVPDVSSSTGYTTRKVKISDVAANSVLIPDLQFAVFTNRSEQTYIPDLKAYFNPCDLNFLNHNPQIWLFRYKKSRGKKYNPNIASLDYQRRKSNAHFAHTVHNNGSNFIGSNLYGGAIKDNAGVTMPPRDTEFGCPSAPYETLKLGVNPDQWVLNPVVYPFDSDVTATGDTFVDNVSILGFARKNGLDPGNFNRTPRSLVFAFAIVIDNPDPLSPYKKIIGPMSESIIYYPQYFEKPNGTGLFSYVKWAIKRSSNIGMKRYLP